MRSYNREQGAQVKKGGTDRERDWGRERDGERGFRQELAKKRLAVFSWNSLLTWILPHRETKLMFFNIIWEQCMEYSRIQLLLINAGLCMGRRYIYSLGRSLRERGGGLQGLWLGTTYFGHSPFLLFFFNCGK